nr:DUF5979 domain-containing protein [Tessaracoccus coleopterorum]
MTIEKVVTGEAASFAPGSFDLTLSCVSVGEDVVLGDRANLTLKAGEPVTVSDIPWGSTCTVTEKPGSGATGFEATEVTVTSRDAENAATITATNRYDLASLVVDKTVGTKAKDQDGNALDHGTFDFSATCTFLGEVVVADGFDASP